MSKPAKYLARLRPNALRAGERITIEIEKGKLQREESGITVELYEVDNFIAYNKHTKKMHRAHGGAKNKDDVLARWEGSILFGKKDGEPRWNFRPKGPAILRDKTELKGESHDVPIGHVLGSSLPIQFEGSKLVYHIPVPFDGVTRDEPRTLEGPELELAVVLKRGGELLYSSWDVVSFVRDWQWWAPTSFAPTRAGNKVRYFHDGKEYFERMRDVFNNARERIYITDWKLIPYVCLRRDVPIPEPAYAKTIETTAKPARPSPRWLYNTLGDTLERAVKREVDVRILVWKSPGFQQDNFDDVTFAYLMDRGIKCAFHNPKGKKNAAGVFWSHHQKAVVADDGNGNDLAFVGGLDLTKNRWDVPGHDPFEYLTEPASGYLSAEDGRRIAYVHGGYHPEEIEQDVVKFHYETKTDPHVWKRKLDFRRDRPRLIRDRNPHMGWHDVHSEIAGPSAVDVRRNFVQRWNRSAPETASELKGAGTSLDYAFLKESVDVPDVFPWFTPPGLILKMVEGIASPYLVPKRETARDRIKLAKRDAEDCRHYEAAEWWNGFLTGTRSWSDFVKRLKKNGPTLLTQLPDEVPSARPKSGGDIVQVLRSITSDSVVLGTKSDDEYRDYKRAMHGDTEKSIQECYLRAIQCAQHYVYIESQMFISAGFPGANGDVENHIARHLYWKIRSKIAKKQWFHVYVVLPEIYDGDPHAAAPKEIQRYQWETMTALRDAVEKLAPAGKSASDYISFYALRAAGCSTDGQKMIRSNLVYVHSKMMIIDDVFLTMGSANINDRSMTGYRDSELNVAVLGERNQEMMLGNRKWHGNERIQSFRKGLWSELLGPYVGPSVLENPAQPQTAAYVQKRARENLDNFDLLYQREMVISDLMGKYRSLRRKQEIHVRDHKQRSAEIDREITAIPDKLEAAHKETHYLYDNKIKNKGLLIEHPYDKRYRKESKGEMSTMIPHLITT